jgi:hypothetical protein
MIMDINLIEILNNNTGLSIIVASISTLISAIAVVIALFYNARTQKQYRKSLEPQLSMRLDKYDSKLYLLVQNTGRTAAENISIAVESIENNGANDLMLDALFSQEYELYPNETIQAMVAISGENVATGTLYPKITINISYHIYGTKIKVQYARTITFSKVYDSKVLADVNMDLKDVESSLKATARATARTANYLDENRVSTFDELNIISDSSLEKDSYSTSKLINS